MKSSISRIIRDGRPTFAELVEDLGADFPLLRRLEGTEQDPEWHAEGNVAIHTANVLNEIYRLLDGEASHLSSDKRCALILGALFHDIAKPITTRQAMIGDNMRTISPRHADRGRSYLALRLPEIGLPMKVCDMIMMIVGGHHDPRQLVAKDAAEFEYWKLAQWADLELLYFISIADLRGRTCGDLEEQLDIIRLFKLSCEELDLWQNPSPYREWKEVIESQIEDPTIAQKCISLALFDHGFGRVSLAQEALAKNYWLRQEHATLRILCGPSGSGKSSWVAELPKGYEMISLDEIRVELTGKRDDQSRNGEVFQRAVDRLKKLLREKKEVIWDGTNLLRDGRARLVKIGVDYGAFVQIVVFQTPQKEVRRQNKKREFRVPDTVLDRQIERMEWPQIDEAHEVVVVR